MFIKEGRKPAGLVLTSSRVYLSDLQNHLCYQLPFSSSKWLSGIQSKVQVFQGLLNTLDLSSFAAIMVIK